MNFPAIPISAVAATLGLVSVGVLYVLHHLRSNPQQLPAATLLFWKQAVSAQQARTVWSKRFTHRKTFVFSAITLVLMALALVSGKWERGSDDQCDVIVIDSGAITGGNDTSGHMLLHTMASAARADLNELPDRTALIAAGVRPLLLVQSDGPKARVAARLRAMNPQDAASASLLAVEMAGDVIGDRDGQIHWYTPEHELPAGLPESLTQRIVLHNSRPADAVAIVGVTFEPSPSDDQHGTLRVRLAGVTAGAVELTAKVDRQTTIKRSVVMNEDSTDATFEGLLADGRIVQLSVGNALGGAAAHVVEFRLPDQRPLTFHCIGDIPAPLRAALLSIGTASSQGSVAVVTRGSKVPDDAQAVIVVATNGKGVVVGTALQFADTAETRGLNLEGALAAAGPALPRDLTPVLKASSATVAGMGGGTGLPTLYLSEAVVGATADLPRRAAFPILMQRLCDKLTHRTQGAVAVAAARAAQDPLWHGLAETPEAAMTAVADRPITATGQIFAPSIRRSPGSISWTAIILAVVLTLLSVDALLRAARKIV